MTTVNFYHDLPVLESFADAIETNRHAQVPGDWWIVIADVMGSTKAIEAGAYKKVNTVGVACIAAVLNVDRNVDVPFVFGGDGATFAVPDTLRERAIPALRATASVVRPIASSSAMSVIATHAQAGARAARGRAVGTSGGGGPPPPAGGAAQTPPPGRRGPPRHQPPGGGSYGE